MIFITGDTHGEIDIKKFTSKNFDSSEMTKDDYVIILGDFGLVWDGSDQEKYWLKWLSEKPWTTLFIDGNHENFDLLELFPDIPMFGGTVQQVHDSIFHLKRGEIYTIENLKFFCFGGGMSHDKQFRTPGRSWWPQEQPTQDEFDYGMGKLKQNDYEVDFVLSHVPPLSQLGHFMPRAHLMDGYMQDRTEHMLDAFLEKLEFKIWFFGHLHLNETHDDFTCLYQRILRLT